jgi:FAD:protein FMN transferase
MQPRAASRLLGCLLLLGFAGCGERVAFGRYAGETMGTYYQVTARCPDDVGRLIDDELQVVNDEMSTYLEDSVLSRFNRAPADVWMPVPEAVADVVAAALALSAQSDGAFDVTVGPLVNLWGFGPEASHGIPGADAVAAAMMQVGYRHLEVARDPPRLRKNQPLYVDLSAIAKGHGVDRLVTRLQRAGCDALLVDIGGEVRGVGVSPSGQPWRIGVEVPDPDSRGAIRRVVALTDAALATSGDYRNFFAVDGRRYSHTIDPRTGTPVSDALASVTVLHPSAMWADGYATLLSVLGAEAGMAFAIRHHLAALFVERRASGFEDRYTPAFEAFLVE